MALKQKTDGTGKSATVYTLPLSLMVHVGILLVIGGTVIIQRTIPKPPPIGEIQQYDSSSVEDMPIDNLSEDLPEPTDLPQPDDPLDVTPTTSVTVTEINNYASTIMTDAPSASSFALPTAGVMGNLDKVKAAPSATKSSGAAGAPRSIKLFSAKLDNVSSLGVILDVSGSAHPFLPAAIKEVEKNFEDSPTFLAFGCGIKKDGKAKVEVYGDVKYDKDKDKPGSRTTLGQLEMAKQRNKDMEKYLKKFEKRNDVWTTIGGDIWVTQYAFETLIDQGVDTIYWFCDFQDKVDQDVMDDLIKTLKKKGIRVIAHNFSGKPVPTAQAQMAKETGGKSISEIPK